MIEDEEVEPGEVRCHQGELLAQRSLRQAQCGGDGEPIAPNVEEHARAVIAPTGKIEAGYRIENDKMVDAKEQEIMAV